MNDPSTLHVGPLGSTIHVLRADAATIAELAPIDWSRCFRRVSLDPARGLVTLTSPSRLHEDPSEILGSGVDLAADALGRPSKGLLATRLRPPGDPPGAGMEPDCAFYVGDRAQRHRAHEGGGPHRPPAPRSERAGAGGGPAAVRRGREQARERDRGPEPCRCARPGAARGGGRGARAMTSVEMAGAGAGAAGGRLAGRGDRNPHGEGGPAGDPAIRREENGLVAGRGSLEWNRAG